MNSKQRIVVLIGVVLVLLSAVFPPYEGEFRREGDNLKKYMGYGFLFVPPSQRDVCEAVYGRSAGSTSALRLCMFNSDIVMSRVWVQLATILTGSIGVVLLLGGTRKQRSSDMSDAGDSS